VHVRNADRADAHARRRRSRGVGEADRRAQHRPPVIEQAKGALAERLQISADDAFKVLRGAARARNLLLSELARDVASGSPGVA
jgi:AmiR/NasT family two-component response regulator